MKSAYILICLIINISICLSQENPQVQKTILINTNLTKEELCQIFSGPNNKNNNTSIEEVETEAISDSETVIKNGKVKMKIKLEFDLNGEQKDQNEKKAFIQTITHIQKEPEKISFTNCLLAMFISFILIGCFAHSLKIKTNKYNALNRYSKKDYLLKDD